MANPSHPQNQETPPHIHWIWMGKREVQTRADTEQTATAKKMFRLPNVYDNALRQSNCLTSLWVDAFTMADEEIIVKPIPKDLLLQYTHWTSDVNARNPKNFGTITIMLRQIRAAFAEWLRVDNNNEVDAMQYTIRHT